MNQRATRVSAEQIDQAARRLEGIVTATPLQFDERLSELTGARVYLKREDLQVVRSYKLRGAYNVMSGLSAAERAAGVVCASAGNHAQGVAFASKRLGIDARIYLPRTTPRQKRDRIMAHGGANVELILTGDTYDEAAAAAEDDVARTGSTLVPPFDDPRTIAGQGTVAAEILEQLQAVPDVVVVPVGGGGLLAGILSYLAERSPSTVLVGAEPAGAASMAAALTAGAPVPLEHLDPFVDGAAVRRVGALPFEIVAEHAGKVSMKSVDEGAVCTEILALYQNEGIIAEPAGALATAVLADLELAPGALVVALITGGNNDVSRYGEIVERSLVHEGIKHYFLVEFAQKPGALRQFLDGVLGPDDDITLFEYVKRNNRETGPALVGIEIGSVDALPGLLRRMADSPMLIEQIEPGSPAYAYLT